MVSAMVRTCACREARSIAGVTAFADDLPRALFVFAETNTPNTGILAEILSSRKRYLVLFNPNCTGNSSASATREARRGTGRTFSGRVRDNGPRKKVRAWRGPENRCVGWASVLFEENMVLKGVNSDVLKALWRVSREQVGIAFQGLVRPG